MLYEDKKGPRHFGMSHSYTKSIEINTSLNTCNLYATAASLRIQSNNSKILSHYGTHACNSSCTPANTYYFKAELVSA